MVSSMAIKPMVESWGALFGLPSKQPPYDDAFQGRVQYMKLA